MRLFLSIAVIACGCGAARGEPGKIIVDDANKVNDKRWKPFDVRLHREERVHGEVVVLSPPLFVRGPPKGFPFRVRTKRTESRGYRSDHGGLPKGSGGTAAEPLGHPLEEFRAGPKDTVSAKTAGTPHEHPTSDCQNPKGLRTKRATPHASGRQNRLPDFYQPLYQPRNPSYYQPGRVQGEVVVHSSTLSIKGPPKGYPLRRKTREAPERPQGNPNATEALKTPTERPISTKQSRNATKHAATKNSNTIETLSVTSKPAKRLTTLSSVASIPAKSSNSTIDSRRGQGTKVKPVRGKQSMMKRLKKMWPYMLIPTMMTLGYAPFVLSSIKMFVMNAFMLNMMAFNAAIMLTLRNMVFGPRIGGHTKYVNYGYTRPQHQGHHHYHGHHHDDRR